MKVAHVSSSGTSSRARTGKAASAAVPEAREHQPRSERGVVTAQHTVVDGVEAVRAASAGFTVLLLGGLVAPLVARVVPVVGSYWLAVVAAVAFVTAGSRIAGAAVPAIQGATAAVGGYLLIVPVVAMTGGLRLDQFATTLAAAGLVGGATGYVRARLLFRARAAARNGRTA